ncbi:3'-5' exonuclease [Aquitalea magnusonii]|uniref:UvrD-like helicase family protein n=1 Tax=Aquitalea magnusonii TaxID=332411 RepID=A0A318JR18_9NEIS|nr:UvrD-like helicase family protein [Aquitalea magnusonii]
MAEFEAKFGRAVTLKLEDTFRCLQSLCDISSNFVQKNPKQLRKRVRSVKPNVAQPVRIVCVDDEAKIQTAIERRVRELANEYAVPGRQLHIYVVGRYPKEREHLPPASIDNRVKLEFVTAHSSKGLEADHVMVPRMTSETLGFPSRIEDGPVQQLAMPGGDTFEDAEELRLFYLTLTRARSTVTLVTLAHRKSTFIAELIRDHELEVHDLNGEIGSARAYPECQEGRDRPPLLHHWKR